MPSNCRPLIEAVAQSLIRTDIQFGVFSPQDVKQLSVLELHQRDLYNVQLSNRPPAQFGVLDKALGTSEKTDVCQTCHENIQDCVGHFGVIQLTLPVFHIGYFKLMVNILQNICKVRTFGSSVRMDGKLIR